MKIKYNLGQQLMAYILLASLFLQSCYNPNIPTRLIPVEQETINLQLTPPEQEPDNQAVELTRVSEPILDLAASSFVPVWEGQVEQNEQNSANGSSAPLAYSKTLAQSSYQAAPLSEPKDKSGFKDRKPGLLKAQNRLKASQAFAQAKNKKDTFAQFLATTNQAAGELINEIQAIIAVAPSKREVSEEASIKLYTTKGGHQVRFQQLASGQWQAVVEESLPAGIKRTLLVPVYILPGYSIATLSEHSQEWQKNHIHMVLNKTKSYVLVGAIGLPGGMYQDEEEEKITKYGYFGSAPSSPNPNTPTEFTSNKGLTYEIFKNITLEIAKEVEAQTGLVILLKPGKTTTGFTIGRGNFGELRLGKAKNSGQYYGIKVLSPKQEKLKAARAEAKLQLRLTGLPHLMPLVDAGETNESDDNSSNSTVLYQVMPLAALGNGADLAAYLQTIKDPAFKEALLVHLAKSILEGFAALHSLNEPIAHLDFKPDNLVIDKNGEVYIIDFGCSVYLDAKDQVIGSSTGDRNYFSPERNRVIYSSKPYFNGKASDNWAVGLSMLELATGMFEYKEGTVSGDPGWYVTSHPFLQKVASGSYAAIVKGFLNPDEKHRLTAEEVLNLPIFQQATRPEVLSFLKEFVQTMQSNKRKEKIGGETSAQQLPLPHFTGYASRPGLEQAVIKQLQEKAPLVACTGMGGVGKTQLLTYLVHSKAIQQSYKHIYWFQAADKEESLLQQYHGLAQELKLPGVDEKTPVEKAKATLLGFLEQEASSTLLVFDNADEPRLLQSFLPQGECQVLLSSRSPKWKNAVVVDVFTASQVKELLKKLLPGRETKIEEARMLGEVLGYLPLALSQAIAWIRQEERSVSEYVVTYEEKQKELLQTSSQLFGKDLPYSMVTLYQMQLAKLSKGCPAAITLLEYTSLLAADNIPMALLSKGLLEEKASASVYEKASETLLQYALWQKDKNGQYVRMHRLMQDVVKLPFTAEKLQEKFRQLAARIETYDEETTLLDDEAGKKSLVHHLKALEALAAKNPALSNEASLDILGQVGRYYVNPQIVWQESASQEKGAGQKKAMDLEKIFDKLDDQHPAVGRVLFLGEAGTGKSTLMQHIAEQWAYGQLWQDKYDHVFQMCLKELLSPDWLSKYDKTEQNDLFACFIHSCLEGQKIGRSAQVNKQTRGAVYQIKAIQQLLQDPRQNQKVLLVVDGYDEIAGIQGGHAYKNILEAGVFEHPHVVMTSRPNAASKEIRAKFERQLELQGLDEAGINQYINLQFKEAHKKELGKELQAFLASNTNVRGMCEVPINMALLCLIWKDTEIRARILKGMQQEGQQDFQLGQLYQELMSWLAKRYANKHNQGYTDPAFLPAVSDEGLLEDRVYKALEQVAYETFTGQGLEKGKQGGILGIPGKMLEEIAQKYDASLKLSDLAQYGLIRGEGDASKPLEQVYEFIHLSFQEYLTASYLSKALGQANDLQAVRKVAIWLAHHRHEPKYLMTLKFLAGLVSQSKDELLVKRFWEAVSCNAEGIIELGLEGKVNLFMHILGQSKIKGKFDARIPHLVQIQQLVDNTLAADITKWQQPIIESGYISPSLIQVVQDIMQTASKDHVEMAKLSAAAEIVVRMANKGIFDSKEQLFDQLMGFTKLKNWQLQKLGLEKAGAIIDETITEQKLGETVKSIFSLLVDDNLEKTAWDLLGRIAQIGPQMVYKNLKPLLTDKDSYVRISACFALEDIVKLLPKEAVKEALILVKPLLADKDSDVRGSASSALIKIVKVLPQEAVKETVKEAFNLFKPLLADEDSNVRSSASDILSEIVKVLPKEAVKEALNLFKPLLADENRNVRISASKALKEIVKALPKEAFNLLKPLLADEDSGVRDYASFALREILKVLPQEEALNVVKSLLADENKYVRDYVSKALIEIVKALPQEEALNVVKSLLAHKSSDIRDSAYAALIEIVKVLPQEELKEALNLFKPLLAHKSSNVRRSACCALIGIVKVLSQEEALHLVKPLLDDKDRDIRISACSALKEIVKVLPQEAVKEAFNLFKPLLVDKDMNVRSSVCFALSETVKVLPQEELKEAFNLFKPLLADKDRDIRRNASSALREIVKILPQEAVKEALHLVKHLLDDKDRDIRISACSALSEIVKVLPKEVVKEAFNVVKPLLAHKDSDIRIISSSALKEILKVLPQEEVKEALNLFKPLFADEDGKVRESASSALKEIVKVLPQEAAKEAFNLVKPLLADKNLHVRVTVSSALREIVKVLPQEEVFNLVKPLLAGKDWNVRIIASYALSEILKVLPQEAIKEAFNLIKTLLADKEGEVVRSASYALREMVKLLPQEAVKETLNLFKPLLAHKDSKVRKSASSDLIEIVKALPQEEVFNLVKPLLTDEDIDVRKSAFSTLKEIIKILPFAELANLLTDSNPTIRNEAKKALAEKFKVAEEISKIDYREMSSLLKIMAENKESKEEIGKDLHIGANKVLRKIADNINQEGIKWFNEHFSTLPNLPEVQGFLRSVQHTSLRDGNLNEEKAQLLIQCIVKKGITATIDPKGNKIVLEDSTYPLGASSQANLLHIVNEVIKRSEDSLAKQYRDHKPLFANSGLALPIAATDIQRAGSILNDTELANDKWYGSVLDLSYDHQQDPAQTFLLLEQRNYAGEHIIHKITFNKEQYEVESHAVNPLEIGSLREGIFGKINATATKPRHYGSSFELNEKDVKRMLERCKTKSRSTIIKGDVYQSLHNLANRYRKSDNKLSLSWSEYVNQPEVVEYHKDKLLQVEAEKLIKDSNVLSAKE